MPETSPQLVSKDVVDKVTFLAIEWDNVLPSLIPESQLRETIACLCKKLPKNSATWLSREHTNFPILKSRITPVYKISIACTLFRI